MLSGLYLERVHPVYPARGIMLSQKRASLPPVFLAPGIIREASGNRPFLSPNLGALKIRLVEGL